MERRLLNVLLYSYAARGSHDVLRGLAMLPPFKAGAKLATKCIIKGEVDMSPAEARLKEVPSSMSDAEWTQRVNLAAAYRLVALYGWDDLVDTHISARVPGPEHHFLINPYGLMFDEITASSLVKVDLDGNLLTESEYSINPAGFTIHSAIHEVREDAGCVLHLHTPDGTAVASCMEGLLPLNQTAQLVTGDLAYHDYEGIALDHDERPRIQKDLGNKNHLLLRNHGTLTVGRSVASAFERMFHLERACTMQVRTRMLGPTAYPVEKLVIEKNEKLVSDLDRAERRANLLVWPPLLRKLDRLDPSYKT
jgi:ribulose-5-phosphate 4-epimerase/fuculose-1-phosphate aldolase